MKIYFKFLSKKFLILFILLFIIIYKYYQIILIEKEIKPIYIEPNDYYGHCEKEEWTDINQEIFFRLSTAYFLIDHRAIIIFYTCKATGKKYKFNFEVEIIYKNKTYKATLLNVESFNSQFTNNYDVTKLNASLNLNKYINQNHINYDELKINFLVVLKDKLKNVKSRKIEAKIKYYHRDMPKSPPIICIEPVYTDNKEYLDIEWWVELNRLIGYEKIFIYNNTIPNSKEFNSLFEMHKNYVEVPNLHCLPYFINETAGKKYVSNFLDLIDVNVEFSGSALFTYGMENIASNECLYKNSDKTNLILMQDQDETFIPPKLDNFENDQKTYSILSRVSLKTKEDIKQFKEKYLDLSQCERPNDKSYLMDYINNIYIENSIPKDKTLYFPQVVFLKQDLMEEIFLKIKRATEDVMNLTFPLKIRIAKTYESEKRYQSSNYNPNFFLVINSLEEFNYATSLMNINEYLIKPMLNKINDSNEYSEKFRRFFYLNGLNQTNSKNQKIGYVGKSFFNPKGVQAITNPHYSEINSIDHFKNYISHFRNRFVYNLNGDQKSIRLFNVDLNYFYCYYFKVKKNLDSFRKKR